MRQAQTPHRGRPLAVLATVILAWITARAILWESPFPAADVFAPGAILANASPEPLSAPATPANLSQLTDSETSTLMWEDGGLKRPTLYRVAQASKPRRPATTLTPPASPAASHQLLYSAAMAQLPVPATAAERLRPVVAPGLAQRATNTADRWSLDAWAFWREGSSNALISQGRAASYGASQAGAVLRYRLAPTSGHDPQAFVRAYRALVSNGETEFAAGISARPLAALPLRGYAELRATERTGGNVAFRPAGFVTTEIAPIPLPLSLRAEAYAQAGYVGGNQATGFADGQLSVSREVAGFDIGKLSLAAGAWGGAQRGANRLDVGPSARLDMEIADTPTRLSVDYRARVAGQAQPGSGVAVTLSTSF